MLLNLNALNHSIISQLCRLFVRLPDVDRVDDVLHDGHPARQVLQAHVAQ